MSAMIGKVHQIDQENTKIPKEKIIEEKKCSSEEKKNLNSSRLINIEDRLFRGFCYLFSCRLQRVARIGSLPCRRQSIPLKGDAMSKEYRKQTKRYFIVSSHVVACCYICRVNATHTRNGIFGWQKWLNASSVFPKLFAIDNSRNSINSNQISIRFWWNWWLQIEFLEIDFQTCLKENFLLDFFY